MFLYKAMGWISIVCGVYAIGPIHIYNTIYLLFQCYSRVLTGL